MGIDIGAERPQRLMVFGQRGCPQRGCVLAKLLYGLPYEDIPEEILNEVNEMLDNGDLDYASPWYGAPRDEWFVGVEIRAFGKSHYDLSCSIAQIDYEIPDILVREDIELLVYVTPHVW